MKPLKSEAEFSKWIRDNFNSSDTDVTRIENSVGAGLPDLNIFSKGSEFWVELKVVRGNDKPLLRPYQYSWGIRRSNKGGRVLIWALDIESQQVYEWEHPVVVTTASDYVKVAEEPTQVWLHLDDLKNFYS